VCNFPLILSTPCCPRCPVDIGERMASLQRVGKTIRAQQQESGRFPSSRQDGQQVESGVVAPVQIFEHQQQRLSSGQQIKSLSQFTSMPKAVAKTRAAMSCEQPCGTELERQGHRLRLPHLQ
jgi:hypothetical protein